MRLTDRCAPGRVAPWNYGDERRSARARRYQRILSIVIGCATLIVSTLCPAGAQPANQPGFDPRQPEKHFDNPQQQPQPPSRSSLPMPAVARPPATEGAEPQFVLRAVRLTGASAISPAQLATAYQPYLGKRVSQADLTAITTSISELYRAAGYHLSRAIIPAQDIADGSMRIQVIEGSITEVSLTGDGAEQFGVRPLLDPVLAEHPSRLATLERQLLLINGSPGVRIVDSTLKEIGPMTGRFRLVLRLKVWHVFSAFALDNLGSSAVGPWQAYYTAAFNSYLLPGDTLALNLSTTPNDPRELGFSRLSYDAPVGTDGMRVGASALYSEVRPGDNRRLFNDTTTTEAFELRSSIVPLELQHSSIILTAAADFSNVFERDIFGTVYNDRIRTVSLTSDYRLQDSFGGNNFATLSYRQGLDILGASRAGDSFISHHGASSNFSVLDFWFTRYQTLANAWSVKLAMASQTASSPLFLSQQFYLGGAAFGRGYGSAEISGDNGLAGSFELRFDQSLNWRYLAGYQIYSFVDAGAVWNDGYSLGDGLALTSAGAGVRLFLRDSLHADISVAFPLSYRAPDNEARSPRLLFSVSDAFRLCPERSRAPCL